MPFVEFQGCPLRAAASGDERISSGEKSVLLEGLRLMAVGMTTVFFFLTLLVGLMYASAVFFEANAHRFPEADSDESPARNAGNDEEIAIAIAVAEASRRGQDI